jgi:hypothetical protein
MLRFYSQIPTVGGWSSNGWVMVEGSVVQPEGAMFFLLLFFSWFAVILPTMIHIAGLCRKECTGCNTFPDTAANSEGDNRAQAPASNGVFKRCLLAIRS